MSTRKITAERLLERLERGPVLQPGSITPHATLYKIWYKTWIKDDLEWLLKRDIATPTGHSYRPPTGCEWIVKGSLKDRSEYDDYPTNGS